MTDAELWEVCFWAAQKIYLMQSDSRQWPETVNRVEIDMFVSCREELEKRMAASRGQKSSFTRIDR